MTDEKVLLELAIPRLTAKWGSAKNVSKGDWYSMTDDEIRSRIYDEIRELLNAMRYYDDGTDWEAMVSEAADILAFALMGADPKRRKPESRYAKVGG